MYIFRKCGSVCFSDKMRYPVLMGGIVSGIFYFYYTFSQKRKGQIKEGSKRFTEEPDAYSFKK